MASVIHQKRALPIFWIFLDKKGASDLREQQIVWRPVIKLLKAQKIVIIGDREFHSIELAQWLHRQKVKFVFRQKKDTTFRQNRQKFKSLSQVEISPGMTQFLTNVTLTQKKGFGRFNLAIYWKRKYKSKQEQSPWYLLTNLPDCETAVKIYGKRFGIEAMFKDCKTGGYNLEGSQASSDRLVRLILLIALAMSAAWLQGQHTSTLGKSSYICRPKETQRTRRRHSNFWIGLYGYNWIATFHLCQEWVEQLLGLIRNKLPFYQRGLRAVSVKFQSINCLETRRLSLAYDGLPILNHLNLVIPTGQITALVGPNGCGKSTLLRGLARLLKPQGGTVYLNGEEIFQLSTRMVAQQLGILPQGPVAPEGLTVRDLVAQGRYPYQSWLQSWSVEDERSVKKALSLTDLTELADRSMDTLSGGQRQRAWIAMTLAQDTQVLLLDEPTTFLDLAHQVEVLELLLELNQTENRTIVMVLHDLNQACRYADHLVALANGEVMAYGPPAQVMTEEMVHQVFGLACRIVPDPVMGTPLCVPLGRRSRSPQSG